MAGEYYASGRQLGRLLAELQSELLVVTTPDHPFLLQGPDALISLPGSLVLVFVPAKHERAQPATFLTRLALSRYAYPSRARCVLLLDHDERIAVKEVTRHFHEVVTVRNVQRIGAFARSRDANPNHVHSIPIELRDDFTARFLSAEQITRDNLDRLRTGRQFGVRSTNDEATLRKRRSTPIALDPWISSKRRSRSFTVFEDNSTQSWFASLHSSQGARLKAKVARVIEHGIRGEFTLDNGVPYPKRSQSAMLLMLDSYREVTWDPLKFLRATAFGGWALVPDDPEHAFDREAARYMEFEAANQRRLRSRTWEDRENEEEYFEE